MKYHTKDGLIFDENDQMISVPTADQIANEYGFMFAERFVKAMEESKDPFWFFTFGFGHHQVDETKGTRRLDSHYTVIQAPTDNDARVRMYERRGNKWASSYPDAEAAGVRKYGLKFIHFDDVKEQIGDTL